VIDLEKSLGLGPRRNPPEVERRRLIRYINLQLIASGLPAATAATDEDFTSIAKGLLNRYHEQTRLLADHRCPADQRVEAFLAEHFADLKMAEPLRLPGRSFILDRHGVARELSVPADGDEFKNSLLSSYRLKNGVLHNPAADRRTTAGTFHVTEGGLPIAGDKKAVPKRVFAELFRRAVQPPEESMVLPFTANLEKPARTFVSLLLRPLVCPEVPGVCPEKRMEVRFFVPGSLVSNLDFVESIFGNAGDPNLAANDAGLDVEHWSGHTGCVVLAPHLTKLTKKELGLPHHDQATTRQRQDGMCWKNASERYNDGSAFKLTCRTSAGVIVTLIADNYYGYCKKEVKTQVSYATNLMGNAEEEHAGGALAFASYSLGDEFFAVSRRYNGRTFDDVARDYSKFIDVQPEGYGIDKNFPDLIYIREDAHVSIPGQRISWVRNDWKHSIPLLPGKIYMTPSGYKVRMVKHPGAPSWRLIGTTGEGTFCHKPSTVSGGGKSEISKSLVDYMLYGPIFVTDIEKDLDFVEMIFDKNYSNRWRPGAKELEGYAKFPSRPILSPRRTLGSVIKLLTPSPDYTEEYNAWLTTIPSYILAMVFIIKRFYKAEWEGKWREHFSVDIVNGVPGHELKWEDRKLVGSYLRIGFFGNKAWRTFKVRQDFIAAAKIQTEDDISASTVVPASQLSHLNPEYNAHSYKFVINCEHRLFQRPDDAIHRGLDRQTERDLSQADNFISNFEPMKSEDVRKIVTYQTQLEEFTPPMRDFLLRVAADEKEGYVAISDHPRLVDGKPTKNPRYLQIRPDHVHPIDKYVAETGVRLFRAIPADKPLHLPVNAVLGGRRNNGPDVGVRPLAVYNPIHYQELPELFMDYVCSLTGKSPSTTGAGSEGALTKGPFNALRPTPDLNSALVSFILTQLPGFSTAAGVIGPHVRVDHDISLLVPEIWCRMTPEERQPGYLIENDLLERLTDFDHKGERILASRLGYRINYRFVQHFFGRIFDNPGKVFDDAMLRPETQDLEVYVDGVRNICEAQQRVAQQYFDDGSIEEACPPLRALLTIMAKGSWEGKDAHHPDVRRMFTLDYLLKSDWYRARLEAKQERDVALWTRHVGYLREFMQRPSHRDEVQRLELAERLTRAKGELERVGSDAYLQSLVGTIGVQPL
jgi:phosphoenolpyruvate carboxykinase (diphosphate)